MMPPSTMHDPTARLTSNLQHFTFLFKIYLYFRKQINDNVQPCTLNYFDSSYYRKNVKSVHVPIKCNFITELMSDGHVCPI